MPFVSVASPNIKQTQAKNKEANQRVGQLPAGPQWNCDMYYVNSLVHEWTLFNISQQIQEDIWIHEHKR